MQSLVGTWRLVEWNAAIGGLPSARPFGGDPVGLLTYTADGRMSATLMRRHRSPLESATLAAATAEQRAAAASGYVAYAGSYEQSGDVVDHHVEVSLFPDWVGGVQRRTISWQDGDLILEATGTTADDGAAVVNRLRWRRITGGTP